MCLVSPMLSLQMGMMTFCPYPLVYELVTSMEDVWTLTLTDALSAGSDCAFPDATIAESANCYVESKDCCVVSIILDLYNAPTSMEFQLLMDSKSLSSGHSSLVDLIGSSTLTPLLLCFIPVGSDNPSKCFELYDRCSIPNCVNVKNLPFDRGPQQSAINHCDDARLAHVDLWKVKPPSAALGFLAHAGHPIVLM